MATQKYKNQHLKYSKNIIIFTLTFLLSVLLIGQNVFSQTFPRGDESPFKNEVLPTDPQCSVGKLSNGITYYVRDNKKPEKRAIFELVVNAGSVVEEENERGYAHFIEHMAFNGTKNYKKEDIVDYFERLGMRFGPEVNAFTTFDETIYTLEVPSDNEDAIIKAIGILSDWAYQISFDPEEVEKERKIILAEMRERSGVDKRVMEKHYTVLFKDSKYGKNLPIGKKEVIENATSESLRAFYRKWYKPERMAIIAVGDFSSGKLTKTGIIELIEEYFSKIPPEKGQKKEAHPSLPEHNETLYSIVSDPEQIETRISIVEKKKPRKLKTVDDYKELLNQHLVEGMINERLKEISRKENPPFIGAGTGRYRIIRTSDIVAITAITDETKLTRAFETLLTEVKRIRNYGFTVSELNREKKEILRIYEKAYNERNSRESNSYIEEYEEHFLNGYAIPGIEYEYQLVKELLPRIKIEDVNSMGKNWFNGKNRVILVTIPEKKGITVPDEKLLNKIALKVESIEVLPYEEAKHLTQLLAQIPTKGKILKSITYDELGITEWILSNGSKVYLKPTRFKKGEVLFEAMSPGGLSLVNDEKFISAKLSTDLISESGVDDIDQIQLEKILSDKIVTINPWIGEVYEGFEGSFDLKDAETFMKLLYLYFTEPRKDKTAFNTFREKLIVNLKNKASNPDIAFWDKLRTLVTNNHPRGKPLSIDDLKKFNLDISFEVYKQRFRNAGDFTFVFVGDFEPERIKPLILTYIGGLPGTSETEEWVDRNIDPPERVVKQKLNAGIENKSNVCIVFAGEFSWNYRKDFLMDVLVEYIDIVIRQRIREKEGGAYDTWAWGYTQKYPDNEYYLYLFFDADPKNVDKLKKATFDEIKKIKNGSIDQDVLIRVREIMRKDYEKSLKENDFWLNTIGRTLRRKEPLSIILTRGQLIESINKKTLVEAAKLFLDEKRYVELVLLPK